MSRPLAPGYRLAVAGGWLAAIWATTHWYGWQETIDLLFGSDAQEYETVAKAAPHFPAEAIPSQHANRFVPHYVVGLGSDLFHAGVRPFYYVCAFALLLALVWIVDRLVAPLRLDRFGYALSIGALVANPYLYRFLAICPGRLADTVFIIGGALALLGLLRGSGILLVAGLVIATLGRAESSFPLLLLAPVGIWLSPLWRPRSSRERGLTAAAAIAVPLLAYALVVVADDSFSRKDHPGFWELTIFGVFRHLPGSAHELGAHSLRVLGGVIGPAALIAAGLVARRMRRIEAPLPFAFWASLVAGVVVAAEGWILSPEFIHGNSGLIAALGSAFLVVAAAGALEGLSFAPAGGAVAIAGLGLVSLHHLYAWISPVSTAGQYGALAAAGAALAFAAVVASSRAP